LVEKIVQEKVFDNWEEKDEPPHLKIIRDKFIDNPIEPKLVLEAYLEIVNKGEIEYRGSVWQQQELLMSGIVRRESGKLKIYNFIYKKIFDRQWIEKQLLELQ